MSDEHEGRVALLWRGDPETRRTATLHNNRYADVFAALRGVGLRVEPAVYSEEAQGAVREQLLHVDGVIVWVNPLSDGRERTALDPVLREVAARGIWVSTHPDVILKMGTKEVLVQTRNLGWGSDCHVYASAAELRDQLPQRLAAGAARVLKRNRGNGGDGVWKVEAAVSKQGSCYMVHDRVAGFGHQRIKALIPPPPEGPGSQAAQPGPRIMHGADAADFQRLRTAMEDEWVPALQQQLSILTEQLPVIWDADFLYGPKTESGEDTYVLCEINVSCVFPFPDQALRPLAVATLKAVRGMRARAS